MLQPVFGHMCILSETICVHIVSVKTCISQVLPDFVSCPLLSIQRSLVSYRIIISMWVVIVQLTENRSQVPYYAVIDYKIDLFLQQKIIFAKCVSLGLVKTITPQ